MTETPLSATLGLLAFGVLVLLIAAVIANIRWPHKHPARQDGNQPPAGRGITPCSVANCGKPATTILRAGFTNWPVCRDCREELEAARGEGFALRVTTSEVCGPSRAGRPDSGIRLQLPQRRGEAS